MVYGVYVRLISVHRLDNINKCMKINKKENGKYPVLSCAIYCVESSNFSSSIYN